MKLNCDVNVETIHNDPDGAIMETHSWTDK